MVSGVMASSAEILAKSMAERMAIEGHTQETLAEASGLTQGRVSQYLRRNAVPTLDVLDRIAAALNTTPADLLGGVTPPPGVPADFLARLGRLPPAAQARIWEMMEPILDMAEAAEGRARPESSARGKADR